ncbi:MAG TPA: ABC transporter permease [Candidatus Saccharimonadales bacterium]|nr:ABC transporter permease [Candidatus Saccharimonadales bacterium]
MILLGLRYALRERTRSALTAAGVACAVVLTVFLGGVYRGALRGSLGYVERAGADVWVARAGTWSLLRSGGVLPGSARKRLEAQPGVVWAEPILTGLLSARVDGEPHTLLVIGLADGARAGVPRVMAAGTPVPRPGEIVVDRAFARRARLALGASLDLAGRRLRVTGISRETNLLVTQYAFVSAADLRPLLGVGDVATFFLVRTAPGRANEVARWLGHAREIAVYTRGEFLENNLREVSAGFLPVLWAVAALGLAAGGTVVALMTYAAVLEKRADYALLAALGGGGARRCAVLMEQALSAALAGGVAGLAALAALERLLPAVVPEIEIVVGARLALAALAGAVGMAALGASVPARLAARVPPMEALRR